MYALSYHAKEKALFASVLEETGNEIGVKSSSRVISGVVSVTTGGLSVASFLLEVYFVIEKGDIVLAQQIEKLAPRQAQ